MKRGFSCFCSPARDVVDHRCREFIPAKMYEVLDWIPLRSRPRIWKKRKKLHDTIFFGNKTVVLVVIMGAGDLFVRGQQLSDQNDMTTFDQAVLPHLNAAYNLARWLTRNDQDADDV